MSRAEQLLQLSTFLIEMMKSGKITISENNVTQMEVKVSDKKLDVNVKDKALIKDVMTSARKSTTSGNLGKRVRKGIGVIRAARDARPVMDNFVEDLCKEGVTITVFYKGDRTITIGSEANSKVTRFVTGTKGVQIDNTLRLAELTL